jgi:hypothetical protein
MPRNSFEKERKRLAVAGAVIAGQRIWITARKLGCSKRHVRRLAAEPTRFLVTEIIRPQIPELMELVPQVIVAVGDALRAMKTDEANTSPDSAPWSGTASCCGYAHKLTS